MKTPDVLSVTGRGGLTALGWNLPPQRSAVKCRASGEIGLATGLLTAGPPSNPGGRPDADDLAHRMAERVRHLRQGSGADSCDAGPEVTGASGDADFSTMTF